MALFGHILQKKNQHNHFMVYSYFSVPHLVYTLGVPRRPFKMHIKKLDHENVTMKCDHVKKPCDME